MTQILNSWEYSWDTIKSLAEAVEGKPDFIIADSSGYWLFGPDEKWEARRAHGMWGVSVAHAIARGYPNVPLPVRIEYEMRVKDYPENNAIHQMPFDLANKRNIKKKPFSWSFSAIDEWMTCPKKYGANRFYCTIPYEENEHTLWGNRVHKAGEVNLKANTPIPDEMPPMLSKVCEFLKSTADKQNGIVLAEEEITINKDMKLTGWFSQDAWGRCKIDVIMIIGNKGYIYDWKTGKIKDNLLQLQLSAAFASLKHPEVELWTPKFVWLKEDVITPQDKFVITKDEIPGIWESTFETLYEMQKAWVDEEFRERRNGLCRNWCPVTDCTHCGG